MKSRLSRRSFLRHSALAAGALSVTRLSPGPNLRAASSPGDLLRCGQIGCGGRAMAHLEAVIGRHKQVLSAIVDPDETRHGAVFNWLKARNIDTEKIKVFTDYRQMFDKMAKDLDAVFIAAPNHHHALPALLAMEHGLNVYCEKPVCHDIGEARKMREMARRGNVATQMGNQGHCEEGYRRLCEFIAAGVIGKVTETHSWTDRANGGVGPRPPYEKVPEKLHWDQWIGPAPYRDYHSDLHPHEWHGWYDFGNGSIGNMGCHILDGVYWALDIDHPTSVELEEVRGGSDERYPTGSRIRWDCPGREGQPPVKVYWYEGLNKTTPAEPFGKLRTARGEARNLPPLYKELQNQYPDEEFGDNGTLYLGEKGVIYTATYGERMHVVPMQKMSELTQPPKTLPRPKDIFTDFIEACRAGKKETAVSFEYGTRLTEFAILGNLAQKAGLGRKLDWDGPNMKVRNAPGLNAWVQRQYRSGWKA